MWKNISLALSLILILIISTFGYFFIKGRTSSSTDDRRNIHLSENERNLVLKEMRAMLIAVNGVIDSLAENDMKRAAESARSAGTATAVDLDPILMSKLPLDFKELGLGTHVLFDELSDEITAGASKETVLRRLSGITARCISCHEGNRISENTIQKPQKMNMASIRRRPNYHKTNSKLLLSNINNSYFSSAKTH